MAAMPVEELDGRVRGAGTPSAGCGARHLGWSELVVAATELEENENGQ